MESSCVAAGAWRGHLPGTMRHSGQFSVTMCVVAASFGRSLGHTNMALSRVPVSGLGLVLSLTLGLFCAAYQWTLGCGDACVSVSFHILGALSNRTIVLIWVVCVFSYFFHTVPLSFISFP